MSEQSASGATAPVTRVLRVGLGVLAACVIANLANAQSFDELAARLTDHPSVQALRSESGARQALSTAARALPDPTVSFSANNVPLNDPAFDHVMMTNKAIGVRQDIPNFGVRHARAAAERSEARASGLRADYQLSLLRAELIKALAEKRQYREQIADAQEKLKLYDALSDSLHGEIAAGRAVYFRLSEVDVERADVDRSLAEMRANLARTDAVLVNLVGEAPDTPPPAINLEVWDGNALTLYATRIADAGIDRARAGVAEGKAAFGPNFGVQFTYHQRQAGDPAVGATFPGDDWFSAGVTFSVPLWAPKNEAPKLRAAKAREASASAAYQTSYRDIREKLVTLTAAHVASVRNINILQAKTAALDETIAALRRNYEAGRGDYAQVLDAEIGRLTLLADLSLERARAITLAAQANSELVTP
ncbi:MAG TPA: TolC family protein [Parvularculaceae bacterium]|nr:TolC family protein [Parvularculaceae bacterium]